MDKAFSLSSDQFKFWHLDFRTGGIRIVLQDGRVIEDELAAQHLPSQTRVATSTFDWENWWIWSTTTKDELILTEGFNPHSPPPLAGRSSVYLDQNRWRTVADTLRDPARVSARSEREAAEFLIDFAEDGGAVLPLSSGHLIETGGLDGERRHEIGVAMASLAHGWQLRNPLDLWRSEAEQSMREYLQIDPVAAPYPIVTEPGALFGRGTSLAVDTESADYQIFLAMLTMPCVLLDVLIDPERTEKNPVAKWVAHHEAITAQIHKENLPKDKRRRLARRRFWNENISLYTTALRRLTGSHDVPTVSDAELKKLLGRQPMTGLLSELFVRRFTDHKTRWRRNDLIDLFHLSSAAAYADYVCAETHTGTQLQEGQRNLGRPQTVFTTLNDLVTAMKQDGV
ncbi:MAG: hypothetical protein INR66_22450 [Gordonia polyisoprenivorans]|nr:hypothetical protein [Gordonia polyisoprenivorans]